MPPIAWDKSYKYLINLSDGAIGLQKTRIVHEDGYCNPSIKVESEITVSLLSLTAPLTLISAYLLLTKPHFGKPTPMADSGSD